MTDNTTVTAAERAAVAACGNLPIDAEGAAQAAAQAAAGQSSGVAGLAPPILRVCLLHHCAAGGCLFNLADGHATGVYGGEQGLRELERQLASAIQLMHSAEMQADHSLFPPSWSVTRLCNGRKRATLPKITPDRQLVSDASASGGAPAPPPPPPHSQPPPSQKLAISRLSFNEDKLFGVASRSVWTPQEDALLLVGLEHYGLQWITIQRALFPNKTPEQLRNRFKKQTARMAGSNQLMDYKLQRTRALTAAEQQLMLRAMAEAESVRHLFFRSGFVTVPSYH
jgi:hypothetical protein